MSDNGESRNPELKHPRLILCEGQGDQSFFRHLILERLLPSFDVYYPSLPHTFSGGRQAFGQMLQALSAVRGFNELKGILVVSDNDENPSRSFQEVAQQISAAEGFARPASPLTIARTNHIPPLVVLMIPWTAQPGTLETLCLISASAERPALRDCLNTYADCTDAIDWPISKRDKMRLRCMLSASCPTDPNTSLVHTWSAGRERLIPLEHECFNQIANFLAGFDTFIES